MEGEREDGGVWVFGYGSLVWKPNFPSDKQCTGIIRDWVRRFWQHSTDHRGVPGKPGRVVTLIHASSPLLRNEFECWDGVPYTWGVAYHIPAEEVEAVMSYLEVREKGGYSRHIVPVFASPDDETPCVKEAVIYVGTETNEVFAGPAPLDKIALQILQSEGPSGINREYLFNLDHALKRMNVHDPHVAKLTELVKELEAKEKQQRE